MAGWAVRLNLEIREGLDDPLAVIDGIVGASSGIESSLREWVRVARSRGHTWQEVADALHVTRQSAWERFKDASPRQSSDPAFATAVEHFGDRDVRHRRPPTTHIAIAEMLARQSGLAKAGSELCRGDASLNRSHAHCRVTCNGVSATSCHVCPLDRATRTHSRKDDSMPLDGIVGASSGIESSSA